MKKKLQLTPEKYKRSWDYCDHLYANNLDKLEEMDKFLEKYKLPKLNQKDTENMHKPITSTEDKQKTRTR